MLLRLLMRTPTSALEKGRHKQKCFIAHVNCALHVHLVPPLELTCCIRSEHMTKSISYSTRQKKVTVSVLFRTVHMERKRFQNGVDGRLTAVLFDRARLAIRATWTYSSAIACPTGSYCETLRWSKDWDTHFRV